MNPDVQGPQPLPTADISPNSLLGKKGWPRYALATSPELVHHVSAMCPALCPPLVRLVLLALAAPPVLVRHLSALCPPCVVGFGAPPLLVRPLSARCPPCVRLVLLAFGRASSPCPPLVRLVSTLCCWLWRASTPCPPLVRQVSSLCPACVVGFGAPPLLVRPLSARCPPCVRLVLLAFGRASSPCPPLVHLVLLALVRHVSLCPPGVRLVSALCPPCVRLVSALCPLWPRLRTLSGMNPPCVHLVSASCLLWLRLQTQWVRLVSVWPAPPSLVRLVSALCLSALSPVWPRWRPQTLSAMCPPCVRFGFPPNLGCHVSVRPCVRLALYPPCVGFGRASKRCVSHVAFCVRHLSAPCLFFVLLLSACFSLFIRSLSVFGWVYGLALAGPLSALRPLFGFCSFVCSVPVVHHLSRGLCGWAFARCSSGHLGPTVLCLKALPRICTLSFVFPLCPFFCLCVVLGFVGVCLCPDLSTELGHAVSLCSAGPRLNRLSLGLW